MDKWQPIETAPRDGTEVLLWIRFAHKRERIVGRWNEHVGGWCANLGPSLLRATNWMPLPAPPQEDE